MNKRIAIYLISLLILSIFFGFFFAYAWARGVHTLRVFEGYYTFESSKGQPLVSIGVGVPPKPKETNILIWNRGEEFMVVTFKEEHSVEWTMKTDGQGKVFDWNGDGLIDEKGDFEGSHPVYVFNREVRIGSTFFPLEVRDGVPYVDGKRVRKTKGEWEWVEDLQ